MELELDHSGKLNNAILSTISEGLFAVNAVGDVILANDRAAELLGMSYDELLGRNLFESYFDVVTEEGSSRKMKCTAILTLESGQPIQNDIWGIRHRSHQSITWVSCNSQPLYMDKGEALSGAVVTMTDITSLKQSKDQLKNSNALMSILIQNLQSGVLLVDDDGKIQFINSNLCRLLQLDHGPEWYIGKDARNVVFKELPI